MNTYRIAVASLLIGCVCMGGCNLSTIFGETLVGSGNPITEERSVDSFTKLDVSGALTVHAEAGEANSVVISGDDNIVSVISTNVSGGTLKIKPTHNGNLQSKSQLAVNVTYVELEETDVSGACTVNVEGVSAKDFGVDISGASTLTISGRCQQLRADLSGASSLKAKSMVAETAVVDASGASNAHIHASETVTADASGASNVRYAGKAETVHFNMSGVASIKPE